MKTNTKTQNGVGRAILGLLVIAATTVSAEDTWTRKGNTEVYGIYQTLSGDQASYKDARLDFDVTQVYGVGIGSNILDQLNLNVDFLAGGTDVTGISGSQPVIGDAVYGMMNINLDYNILKYRLTPVVVGGVGVFNMSGDLNGYSFSETNLSYNLGIGARWDITKHLFAKALYRSYWTTIKNMGSVQFDGFTASLGVMF